MKYKINDFDNSKSNEYHNNLSFSKFKEPVPRLIKDILSDFRNGEIDLQPDFQRKFVWNKKKQKELIRSLFAGFPLPMFYFAETKNGNVEVVDGQQRLTTIFGFLEPSSLNNIRSKLISKVRLNFNGNVISSDELAEVIKKRKMPYCVSLEESSMSQKYDIFQLLNQGATILKAQEIRNCLFANEMPAFNKLLKNEAIRLRKITHMSLDRMLGEELALRFFVINKYGYEKDVTNNLNDFNSMKIDLII